MNDHTGQLRTGARRLFGKFLLVLVPIYLVCSTLGLSYIGQRAISDDEVALTSRVADRAAFIANRLASRQADLGPTASEIVETLLSDPAIACVEVIGPTSPAPLITAPSGSGCGGIATDARAEVPIGADGGRTLVAHYRTDEIAPLRDVRRMRAAIAVVLGLVVAIGANYLAFRLLVGRRLDTLLEAIRQTGETRNRQYVAPEGRDELTEVAQAYNEMQARLATQSERVRRKSQELEAEIGQRRKAERAALEAKKAAEARRRVRSGRPSRPRWQAAPSRRSWR